MASSDTARLISVKDGEVSEYQAGAVKDIADIRGMMTKDTSNGIKGLTANSLDLLGADGLLNPDANYFDIYYDPEGKPFFLFNQFNPLFGWYESRNDSYALANACSYCSMANAFILGAGVHSVVDSFGIYLFTLDYGRKTDGTINTNSWYQMFTGNTKDWEKYSNFGIFEKYLYNQDGSPRFQATKVAELPGLVNGAIQSGDTEASFAFKMNLEDDSKTIGQIIADAEAHGYTVKIDVGNCAGGLSGNVFGSLSDSGHFVGVEYDTRNGASVIDSFGNRSSRADRAAGTELHWSRNGAALEYHENRNHDVSSDGTSRGGQTFWHDSSVMTGTSYDTFPELVRGCGIGGGGGMAYITITRQE